MSKVYLTGAGPGELELLTLKALRVIKQADVIIYDRLANSEILKEVKDGCEFIYVGKADGHHTLPQDDINRLIYTSSQKFKCVVRLKGGDPFVFGRGGEEALYLKKMGVDYEVIPGISSAISVPAYAGIPVTHRGISTSFKVITGHISADKNSSEINWQNLKGEDTLVFLMGLKNIKIICSKLLEINNNKNISVAVISKGTTPDQKVITGKLKDIANKVKDIPTPALIVVGKVVELRESIKWFENE